MSRGNWVLSISQRVSARDGRGGAGRARGAVPLDCSGDACQALSELLSVSLCALCLLSQGPKA